LLGLEEEFVSKLSYFKIKPVLQADGIYIREKDNIQIHLLKKFLGIKTYDPISK